MNLHLQLPFVVYTTSIVKRGINCFIMIFGSWVTGQASFLIALKYFVQTQKSRYAVSGFKLSSLLNLAKAQPNPIYSALVYGATSQSARCTEEPILLCLISVSRHWMTPKCIEYSFCYLSAAFNINRKSVASGNYPLNQAPIRSLVLHSQKKQESLKENLT